MFKQSDGIGRSIALRVSGVARWKAVGALMAVVAVVAGTAAVSMSTFSQNAGPDAGATVSAASGSTEPESGDVRADVLPGVDVLLADSLHLVEGHAVGLVTNHTGVDREGMASIDRLDTSEAADLVALFSPEHGIRGEAEAGELVASDEDPETGLPIHSLYGDTRQPTPEMLDGVDVLLFDIQDVGTRYYTYIYTMALAMEAAGEEGIPFVVLDRPNPIGGHHVQGNVLREAFATFVGLYPIPMRHGMTPGELALLFQGEFGVDAQLHVVPADGWERGQLFPDTGLPWQAPSPNMPDLESALHYPGTCLFEGTNLSVGRGTDRAFQKVGAPWLDAQELAERVDAHDVPGVRAHPAVFTPHEPGDGKFGGQEVEGVRLEVTDPEAYDPTHAGAVLLAETREMSGDRWQWHTEHFDRLAGTDRLREDVEAGRSPDVLRDGWDAEAEAFRELREPYLLYP